jgi:hypothetical protein
MTAALDPLQQRAARHSEAKDAKPDEDPCIQVRVVLDPATGTMSEPIYDAAQVDRALRSERPDKVAIMYRIEIAAEPSGLSHAALIDW